MLTKHNVYSAKVMLFSDSTKGFLYYFTSEYVFSSFRGFQDRFSRENLDHSPTIIYVLYCRGQSGFAVGLSVSDKLSVLNSIPIALRHHDAIMEHQHQGLKPSLVPISIPCGD